MKKTYTYIALGLALTGIGFLAYKTFARPNSKKEEENNGFPIFPNPLCSDGESGGCPFDQRVQLVQEYLNGEGANIAEDGLFGEETSVALENYLDDLSDEEFTALGYNYVENANYITLAFYTEHLP